MLLKGQPNIQIANWRGQNKIKKIKKKHYKNLNSSWHPLFSQKMKSATLKSEGILG